MSANIQNPQSGSVNPLNKALGVDVSIPNKIDIKMADIQSLRYFEWSAFLASLFTNFTVGFGVAAITANTPEVRLILYIVTAAFLVFTIIFGLLTITQHRSMNTNTQSIHLAAVEDKDVISSPPNCEAAEDD